MKRGGARMGRYGVVMEEHSTESRMMRDATQQQWGQNHAIRQAQMTQGQ